MSNVATLALEVALNPMDSLARFALADALEESGDRAESLRQRQIGRLLKRGKIQKKNQKGKALMDGARKNLYGKDCAGHIVPAVEWSVPEDFTIERDDEILPQGRLADYQGDTEDWNAPDLLLLGCRLSFAVKKGQALAIQFRNKVTVYVHPDDATQYGK